jgi:two-component system response regulator DctR
MQPVIDALVFVVDDDASVREALAWLLRSRRLLSEVFDSAEAYQRKLEGGGALNQPACLLLDVRMPGLSGRLSATCT